MSWRHFQDALEANKYLLEYIFVKHVNFSKLVYRLKACNFASEGIAKKSDIKLAEPKSCRTNAENLWDGVHF